MIINKLLNMKTKIIFLSFLFFIFSCANDKKNNNLGPIETWNDIEKVSYSIGIDFANMMMTRAKLKKIDHDEFMQGIKDVYSGDSSKYIQDEYHIRLVSSYMSDTNNRDLKDLPVVSYFLGSNIGSMLKPQLEDLSLIAIGQGVQDVYEKNDLSYTLEEAQKFMQEYFQQEHNKKAVENLSISEDFLSKNKNKSGITTTASGLQYKILSSGNGGKKPLATSKVNVHYHGTLINGDVFDSSVDRGEPITFGLNQVIPAWTEGVQLMSEGDKFRFFVHPNLGYGERGAGAKIGPNVVLIFDVELLKIED